MAISFIIADALCNCNIGKRMLEIFTDFLTRYHRIEPVVVSSN